MISQEEIRSLVEHKLAAMGLELYDMLHHRAGRHSVLRVYIDAPSGVSIETCENASRELSVMLDVEDFSSGPYSLEVSSPGLDRPLRSARDFLRMRGREVTIEVDPPVAQRKRLTGTVQACDDGQLRLSCGDDTVAVPFDHIRTGKAQLPF